MYYIGVDIGGTKCSVSLGKESEGALTIIEKHKFNTIPNEPIKILEKLSEKIYLIMSNNELFDSDIEGIGISCGGPLDSKNGIILSPPNLPGWDDIHIVDYFKNRLSIRTILQNDANACAIAEWKFGAGRGKENMIFITFGTGFGSGMILNGRLYTGTNDMAGEIGHIRIAEDGPEGYGKNGSLEGFCSGGGISRLGISMLANKKSGYPDSMLRQYALTPDKITAKLIADLANDGDELCKEIYRISGEKLGQGLSILIDILNPEVIIIGSIFTRSQNLLWNSAREIIEKESLPRSLSVCAIVTSQLGDNIGDYAALSVATGGF
ncbi:MAG: ROK family protein [Saccharofermentanales bacterium]